MKIANLTCKSEVGRILVDEPYLIRQIHVLRRENRNISEN